LDYRCSFQEAFTSSGATAAARETTPRDIRSSLAFERDFVMGQDARRNEISIPGPDGAPMTLSDLPSPATRRWIARRKAQVVFAVEGGLISFHDACARYNLTLEEFQHWEVDLHLRRLSRLKITPRGGEVRRV
jgi:hypothetical protein